MPATPWLQMEGGEIDLGLFVQAAMRGTAMTAVGPGQDLQLITLDMNNFRPIRPGPGNLVARGRVINTSRFYTYTELHVEDPNGRQIMHVVGHGDIRNLEPPPPPPPAALAPAEEPVYATPDPYLRSMTWPVPSIEELEQTGFMAAFQRSQAGYVAPLTKLIGGRFDEVGLGKIRFVAPASGWLCMFDDSIALSVSSPGAGRAALQTLMSTGFSYVGLSEHTEILRAVKPDGRLVRAESGFIPDGDVRICRLYDADDNLVCITTVVSRAVPVSRRQRAAAVESRRMLCTLLFTDIVGSTQMAERLGDQKWHALLEEQRKKVRVEIVRNHGVEIDTAGDGFFVRFDSPAEALECAIAAREAVKPLGIEIRAGVHTGECEVTGRNYAGMAVHMGARIMSTAGPGEIFVSSTVKDLVMGSGRNFADQGEHELKGVPGSWRLYALV